MKLNALACGVALAVSGFASAQIPVQEESRTTTTTSPDGTTATTEIRRVTQVIGSNVALQGANDYGKVEDIVFDENGCIEYLVFAHDNQFAMLPWTAANLNYNRRVVMFDVTPQVIQPLFFARKAWPNRIDSGFTTKIQKAFGQKAVRREVRRPVPNGTPPANPVPPGRGAAPPRGAVNPPPARPPGAPANPPGRTEEPKSKTKKDGSAPPKEKKG